MNSLLFLLTVGSSTLGLSPVGGGSAPISSGGGRSSNNMYIKYKKHTKTKTLEITNNNLHHNNLHHNYKPNVC